jgi:lysophospholipase L1-like esterase
MAQDVIDGLEKINQKAHSMGIHTVGCTLTPFGGFQNYDEKREHMRCTVNSWIRNSKMFDGVIDFSLAIQDAENLTAMLPEYDCGDHLHPSAVGGAAMADAVDIDMLAGLATACGCVV